MIINTCAKRGKGKRIVDLGIKDSYDLYCLREKNKQRKPKNYKLYSSIIKEANILMRDSIVLDNEPIILPYKLGTLGVIKYKPSFNEERKNFWKVNYKRSKEVGFIVYYDQEFRYRWKWDKRNLALRGKKWYTFYPCRTASRLIPKALRENNKLDYCDKLL